MISKFFRTGATAIAAALIVAACASASISLPPITSKPSGLERFGVFVWHDLLTTDPDAAKRFYGGLFGWTFTDFDVGRDGSYTVIYNGETPIGGIVDARVGQDPDPVIIDFPIAYIKSPIPTDDNGNFEQQDLREQITFDVGSDLYFRDRASPTALDVNITGRITGGITPGRIFRDPHHRRAVFL